MITNWSFLWQQLVDFDVVCAALVAGLKGKDIDIVVTSSSAFQPIPSLATMLVSHTLHRVPQAVHITGRPVSCSAATLCRVPQIHACFLIGRVVVSRHVCPWYQSHLGLLYRYLLDTHFLRSLLMFGIGYHLLYMEDEA